MMIFMRTYCLITRYLVNKSHQQKNSGVFVKQEVHGPHHSHEHKFYQNHAKSGTCTWSKVSYGTFYQQYKPTTNELNLDRHGFVSNKHEYVQCAIFYRSEQKYWVFSFHNKHGSPTSMIDIIGFKYLSFLKWNWSRVLARDFEIFFINRS